MMSATYFQAVLKKTTMCICTYIYMRGDTKMAKCSQLVNLDKNHMGVHCTSLTTLLLLNWKLFI